jgi:chromosome segregation ATPase
VCTNTDGPIAAVFADLEATLLAAIQHRTALEARRAAQARELEQYCNSLRGRLRAATANNDQASDALVELNEQLCAARSEADALARTLAGMTSERDTLAALLESATEHLRCCRQKLADYDSLESRLAEVTAQRDALLQQQQKST